MAKYISRRFIDFFRPGQEIPAGHYDAKTLAALVSKGHVAEVNEALEPTEETVEPEKPKTTRKPRRK